jgi:hypothetical protein
MVEAVAYYQPHGFFAAGPPEFALSEAFAIHARRRGRDGGRVPPLEEQWPHRDLGLLELDEERVLYLDFETDEMGGSGMYIATIPRIARITRGVFSAWDVRERALEDERWGRVELRFRIGGGEHQYEVRGGNSDWLDPRLLWIVDDFLQVSPYRLHAEAQSLRASQGGVFAVLSGEERTAIQRDRGLVFLPLPKEPAPPWDWNVNQLIERSPTT